MNVASTDARKGTEENSPREAAEIPASSASLSPYHGRHKLRTTESVSASVTPMPHFKTPTFEGPLDLLLHLIRASEVDIYDIPIAVITEQYLEYMEMFESLDLAVAGEYVVIAATLIEIKSRLLLPLPPPLPGEDEPEDPRAELVARLLEYQQYQFSVETLKGWEELRRQLFFRGALENNDDYILPVPQGEANVSQLVYALQRLLSEAGVDDRSITTVTPRRRLSLRLKMAEIARKIGQAGAEGLPFERLIELPCPRYDIVLTFLALLELLRMRRVRFDQEGLYAPIWLTIVAADIPAVSDRLKNSRDPEPEESNNAAAPSNSVPEHAADELNNND